MRRPLLLSLPAVLALPAADALAAKPKLSPKASAVSAGGVAKSAKAVIAFALRSGCRESRPMRRLLVAPLLAALALPATADAAAVKISTKGASLSPGGVASIEVSNPNRYALRGKATLTARNRTLGSKNVTLAKRAARKVTVRLNAAAVAALRAANGRATLALKLRRSGRKKSTTARRTLTLQLPGAGGAPPPTGAPTPTKFAGRMGSEGAYDDLEMTIENGQMTLTKTPLINVLCTEAGGSYDSAFSLEVFNAPGPWSIATGGEFQQPGIAVNTLVGSGERTITYKVGPVTRASDKVTGTLGMSFSGSKFNIFDSTVSFINCSANQAFEAIPAP